MPEYVENYGSGTGKDIGTLRRYIDTGNIDGMRDVFNTLFASIPYTENRVGFEHDFQTVFTLLGKYVHYELHSDFSRADCEVETADFIYLFEFKRDSSSDDALHQIEEKHYELPYPANPRKLIKIGVNLDSQKNS